MLWLSAHHDVVHMAFTICMGCLPIMVMELPQQFVAPIQCGREMATGDYRQSHPLTNLSDM